MRTRSVMILTGFLGLLVSEATLAQQPAAAPASKPAEGGVRRDPKGLKGISPFWEAIKKGDDALVARDIDSAIAAYKEALSKEPNNPMGHYRIGEAMLVKGDMNEAKAALESAKRFSGNDPTLRAKAIFVLADIAERERNFTEATNSWNAYDSHAKSAASAKTYPATSTDRKKRIEDWKKLETDYAAVKERIKKRQDEADQKLRSSAPSK